MNDPWTEDEDFYLSQGYAIFHDEKTDIWNKVLQCFPFRESRKASDLQERWRILTDQLETEDQGTLERIKSASKLHPQTWKYNYEPIHETPDFNDVISELRSLPSLSMKTQSIDLPSNNDSLAHQNINEMCLNHQFDANSIQKIVHDALNKLVANDETLKATLMREFKGALTQKGREFAFEDIARKINTINEMVETQAAENEVIILMDYFDRIFQGSISRIRTNIQNVSFVSEIVQTFMMLHEKVRIPPNANQALVQFYHTFSQKYLQTFASILTLLQQTQNPSLLKSAIDFIIRIDKNHEIDKHISPQFKQYFMKIRPM